jgi:imidazolonepropionase-like amidohydrolase
MTPHEVIVAATATNAEMIGMKGQLGCIAPGALADLIAIDGDPLTDLGLLQGQGAHLPLIIQGGRIHKNAIGG